MRDYEPYLFHCCVAVALFALNGFCANTWYVDDDNYDEACGDSATAYIAAGFDGTTTNKAFGTIQAAIDYSGCKAGDTIKVMPGIYDKGYYEETVKDSNKTRSRIYVNKKVYIEAVGTKEETHIVGRWMPTSEGGTATYHSGSNSVRCVRVVSGGCEGTLKGFTLRDGAAHAYTSSTYGGYMGGAISSGEKASAKSYRNYYVIDCVISNTTTARYGGACNGGTYIRCRFHNSLAAGSGAALAAADAINCVFTKCEHSSSYYTLLNNSCKIVNCTIYGCKAPATYVNGTTYSRQYNCVFIGNNASDGTETNGLSRANVYATTGRAYKNASPDQLFAPVFDDFHPVAGSITATAGETKWLTTSCPITLPEALESEKYIDMDGKTINTNGETIAAGAYQTTKTPQYGGIMTTGGVSINGVATYGENVFFASEWPMMVRAAMSCHRFDVTGVEKLTGIHTRFMDKEDTTWLVPPYAAGCIKTNTYVAVGTELYVDQVNGSDETGTGSNAKPFATIQKAVSATSSTSAAYVIHVAEGDYDTGGAVGRGVTNRINLTGARWIKFVATGDRDKTIIRGAAAKDERDPENHPGCGPDAVRCVSSSYSKDANAQSIAFVGFTFADGHTDVGQDADNDMGGAGFGRNSHYDALQFIDCVFTNCYAPAAGVAKQAHFTRCRFIDCGGSTDGFRNAYLSSCEVGKGSFGTGVLGTTTHIFGTSIANDNAVASGATPTLVNSLLGDGGSVPSSVVRFWGSTANSCFADAENGDLRPVSGSPALDASRRTFPAVDGSDWRNFALYFADLASIDVNRKAWVFGGDYPVAGALMEWVPGVSVPPINESLFEITGGKIGGNPLEVGETVSISRRSDVVRHYGLVINGVTNMLDNGAAILTASDGMDGYVISSVLDQNWYVNPDSTSGASDENNGFTPATAKLTLKGALSVATNSGDIVHAARGTYNEESMNYSEKYGDARAVVKSNITLVGDEGPEYTTIEGKEGPTGAYKEGGLRCVMLQANAMVKGFTLTKGHSSVLHSGSGDGASVTYNGGGAWANSQEYTARVVDCVITNCGALSGGGAFGVALFGTTLVDNKSKYGVATQSSLYGCLVGVNDVASSGLYQCYEIFDTTAGTSVPVNGNTKLRNSIVLGSCGASVKSPQAPYNTIFCGSTTSSVVSAGINCVFTNKASLGLVDYRPSARGAACETGDESLLPANATNAKMLQEYRAARPIMNGTMDAGCYEADWSGAYAQDIARKRITVTGASTNVVETEERHVRINPGQSLAATWNCGAGAQMNYELNFRVVGTGTLSVVVNGVETSYDTEGDHTLRLSDTLADASLSFVYSGDDGYAEILPWKNNLGTSIIIR